MEFTCVIESLGKRDPSPATPARLVNNRHDAVPIDVNQLGGPCEPSPTERPKDQKEVLIKAFGHVVEINLGETGQRVRLGAEEICWSKPMLVEIIVGPTNSVDVEFEPAVVERLNLCSQGRVEANKSWLQFKLLKPGNGDQFSLKQQSISNAHRSPTVPPRPLGVGCQIRQHGYGLTGAIIDNRDGCHDRSPVGIDSRKAGG